MKHDYAGKTVGNTEVISKTSKNLWLCKCVDCKKEIRLTTTQLLDTPDHRCLNCYNNHKNGRPISRHKQMSSHKLTVNSFIPQAEKEAIARVEELGKRYE